MRKGRWRPEAYPHVRGAHHSTWTDEQLDDLSSSVHQGFSRLDADTRELLGEVAGLRGEMTERFDSLSRLIIQVGGGIGASVLVAVVGIVATRV